MRVGYPSQKTSSIYLSVLIIFVIIIVIRCVLINHSVFNTYAFYYLIRYVCLFEHLIIAMLNNTNI